MQTWLSYLNGEWTEDSPRISVYDSGFVQGLTVSEQLRTFHGRLFRLEDHLARLRRSLEIVGVSPNVSLEELGQIATRIAGENHARLAKGHDLGITMFVTPGPYPGLAHNLPVSPTVCVHAQPLLFRSWFRKYESGQHLVIAETRQVSSQSWPTELKCRSRMHYYLADREAQARDPLARAVLLDLDGFVSEASTANILLYLPAEGFVSPLRSKILPGISLEVLRELATDLKIPFRERDILPNELSSAGEVLLCSTSPCVLPVTVIDGRTVADGKPGPMFRRLIRSWSDLVGVDIVRQAQEFSGEQD